MNTELSEKKVSELTTEELNALIAQKNEEERVQKLADQQAYEELRDELICRLILDADQVVDAMTQFKARALSELEAHFEVLKERAGRGGAEDKGNFSLTSLDGQLKVEYRRNDIGEYDERASQAEAKIKEFLSEKIEDEAVRDVILLALGRRNGQLDPNQVRKLQKMRHKFGDPRWLSGLDLLEESFVVKSSKTYVNFFRRNEQGKWKLISLDFASL